MISGRTGSRTKGWGVKDADPGHVAVIGDRADDGQDSVSSQRELTPPVLPDGRIGARLIVPRRFLVQDYRLGLDPSHHLAHELVNNDRQCIHTPILGATPPRHYPAHLGYLGRRLRCQSGTPQ
jgi:hypothetical protein